MEKEQNKAIFLDRDDTIIEDSGYINNPDQVKLISGVAKSLLEFKEMGFKLIVVSNQSGVARGILTEKTLADIHERLKVLLAEKGVFLDGIYYCPFHPEGVIPEYKQESDDRKPAPGMFLTASQEHNIDLKQSWAVGNSPRDVDAGKRAGCKTILIETKSRRPPELMLTKPEQPPPDYKAVNMQEAVNIVKKYYRDIEQQQRIESTASRERIRIRTIRPPIRPPPEPQPQPAAAPEAPAVVLAPPPSTPAPMPAAKVEQAQVEEEKPVQQPLRFSRRRFKVIEQQPVGPASPEPQKGVEAQEQQVKQEAVQNQEGMLGSILRELKILRRSQDSTEFSIIRLFAGLIQGVVFFCLLVSILLLIQQREADLVLITLGFATVLQLMALTLYLLKQQK